MTHNRKVPEPTYTSRVEEALERADDFMTAAGLVEATGIDLHHVSTCIWYMNKVEAIQSLESDGQLWWFLTPDRDRRTKKVEMRRPEDKPRRARRSRKVPAFPQIIVPATELP